MIVINEYCMYKCVGVSMKWIAIGEFVQNEKAAPARARHLTRQEATRESCLLVKKITQKRPEWSSPAL